MARQHPMRRHGQTLLELMAATMILAMALVPALRMTRDSLRAGRNTEQANHLASFAASALEQHLLLTAGDWSATNVDGDFSAEGFPAIKFHVTRSDAFAEGGIPGSLMAISSTAWNDVDGDGEWSAGEQRCVVASKLAHIVSYEQEAEGP